MEAIILVLLVIAMFQCLQVGIHHEWDEDAHQRMQQREEMLSQEMTQQLQELEQETQEPGTEEPDFYWEAWTFAAMVIWWFWIVAGVLIVHYFSRRSHDPDRNGESEDSSSGDEEQVHEEEQEDEEEREEEEEEEEEEEREEEDEEDPNAERDLGKIFMKRIQWPVQNLAYRSRVVNELVNDLLCAIREHLPKSFYAVLQTAMKVGSVFEGWDPHEDDAVYQMLVPLKPPCGYTFHLELGSTEDIPERNFSVRVQLECTCTTEQPSEERLCLLHSPEKNLSRNEHLSLLDTLCTRSYLDIHKTALWFQKQVRSAWVLVPQSHHYNMVVLPSSCSCKLRLTSSSRRSLSVEVLFGVQQGDSDIFLSSQSSETIFNPSTTWLESYAVAEFKFFRNMALRVPYNSIHLKCLQIFARIVVGTCFPTYTMKTIVMHLLTTIPLSGWCRRHFLLRLMDIMGCLCCCLENARLNHFFFGNENVPKEIILPPALRTAKPFNLFQHIEEDPATQAEALGQYHFLLERLQMLLFYGH